MKHKTILFSLIAALFIAVTGCDDAKPDCSQAGDIEHSLEAARGVVRYYTETGTWAIGYSVPGSVDSAWTGIICHNASPNFELTEGMNVQFSGNFRDDQETLRELQLSSFAGHEFFYLELLSIEKIE